MPQTGYTCEVCGRDCRGGPAHSPWMFPTNLPPVPSQRVEDTPAPVPPPSRGRRRGEHRAHVAPQEPPEC